MFEVVLVGAGIAAHLVPLWVAERINRAQRVRRLRVLRKGVARG